MLEPTYVEVIDGRANIQAVFSASKGAKVAGVLVTEGKVTRNSLVRVRRGKDILADSTVASPQQI